MKQSNTEKAVYAKLSTQKVELALIEDGDKLFKIAQGHFDEAERTQSYAQNGWKISSYNFGRAIDAYEKALQAAKDLGADKIVQEMNKKLADSSNLQKTAKAYENKLDL